MSERFDIAPDHRENGEPVGSWYVCDMRTVRQPDENGVNVSVAAGPFPPGKPSLAAKMRDWMNKPWWWRALHRCPNRFSLLFAMPLRDMRKTYIRWGAFRGGAQ